jgi:DNA-binding Xre family transcriptional regulator
MARIKTRNNGDKITSPKKESNKSMQRFKKCLYIVKSNPSSKKINFFLIFFQFPEAIPLLPNLHLLITSLEVLLVNYQLALTLFLQEQNTSLSELSLATGFSERWLRSICQDCSWIPRLDTLLILCEAIGIDVIDYLAYAESRTERGEVTHTHTCL